MMSYLFKDERAPNKECVITRFIRVLQGKDKTIFDGINRINKDLKTFLSSPEETVKKDPVKSCKILSK